jgi:hypothetical protein
VANKRSKNRAEAGVSAALHTFPLFDELFLSMQLTNLDIVDRFLRDQEKALLADYMDSERTPPWATLVSALSQLWVFGVYELLRTWRQRSRSVLRWAKEFKATPPEQKEARLVAKKQEIVERSTAWSGAAVFHWTDYERVAKDEQFSQRLREAFDRTERLFRRIEALRISLAKHELPGAVGSFAVAPGYGRIDMGNGSILWEIVLRGNEVDQVSRREIADDCVRLGSDRRDIILSEAVQEKLKKFPDLSYGVKRLVAVLSDGTEYAGVHVAWAKEILGATGFGAKRIVDVRPDE